VRAVKITGPDCPGENVQPGSFRAYGRRDVRGAAGGMTKLDVGPQDMQWFNKDGTPTIYTALSVLKQIMENLPSVKVANTDPTATQTIEI
jgi:hypothetical protein